MRAARLAALAMLVAAAVSSPATPLSRQFLCFFGPGSAELSPRCQTVALAFLEWWHRARRGEDRNWLDGTPLPARSMQIEVHGHADAAEAASGGASVSRARAETVAAFLRLNGVPAEAIKVIPFGAERLLVQETGAEPQNRRVELGAR